ncbi:MAG TPA: hypothetical protein VIK91_07745 [Nannocystis sp.]
MLKRHMAWVGLALLVGCNDSDPKSSLTITGLPPGWSTANPQDPPPGSETQPCVDGQCLGDLVCLSNVCVDPGGQPTTGETSTGGTTGGAMTSEPTTGGPATSSPATDGPATGDPATSGPPGTTTGDSTGSSTGQPDLCGNGVVDEGEECDDGNNYDTDLCSNDCTDPTYPVKFTNQVKLPLVGSQTGNYTFDDLCENATLNGHNASRTMDNKALSFVEGICYELYVVPDKTYPYLYFVDYYFLDEHGSKVGGLNEQETCDGGADDHALAGLRVYLDFGGSVVGWRKYCSNMTLNFDVLTVHTPYLDSWMLGVETGTYVDHKCPDGFVAIGYHGRMDNTRLHAIGLTCAKPVP